MGIRWIGYGGLATLAFAGLGFGWLGPLDGEPPTLAVAPVPGPVSGEVRLDVRADDPQGVSLSVSVDGQPPRPVPGSGWSLDTTALSDGSHVITVIATDGSWRRNESREEVILEVDNTPPSVALVADPAAQGRTSAFFVATDEPAEVTATLAGRDHPVHSVGELRWRGLMGFAAQQPPGTTRLEVRATDAAGNVTVQEVPVEIASTPFEHGGYIRLTPTQTQARTDRTAIDDMRAERDAAFDHVIEEQLWVGPMRMPVTGRKTSPFGRYRTYSDGHRSHHTGVDLANQLGTPVVSSADGEVRVAGWQTIYGNVVIVHHGQGVATNYNHLDSVGVEVGQRVRAGEVIGRLGTTGQSTGPHLHWGLTVHGVEVDAEQWLQTGFELGPEVEATLTEALRDEEPPAAKGR